MSVAAECMREAERLVKGQSAALIGIWPKAAAFLGRQALEEALSEFWLETAPGMEETTTTSQLVCLPMYLEDQELATGMRHTWVALSRACHHHIYELAPTIEELDGWLRLIRQFLRRKRRRGAGGGG